MRRVAGGIAIAAMLAACESDPCEQGAPSIAIDLTLADLALAARARSLEVQLVVGADRYRTVYELGQSFADGRTSLAAEIVPAPSARFDADIAVRVYEASGASGELLGEG